MMADMTGGYWQDVMSSDRQVPQDRPLADLTAELTTMLGSTNAAVRDAIAYPTLATWIERGVYDDLLAGLGDGMAAGLRATGPDGVFRRSFSALILAEAIERNNTIDVLPSATIFTWTDQIAAWLLGETDVRGWVVGKGWAHAVAHGADALWVIAKSPHLGGPELAVLLDVIADRVVAPAGTVFIHGETDRLARATMAILRRGLVSVSVVEPWISRIARAASHVSGADGDPFLLSGNAEAYLRALHLQLAISETPPPERSDLLLALVAALKSTNQVYLRAQDG